jgi:hypothetical protein
MADRQELNNHRDEKHEEPKHRGTYVSNLRKTYGESFLEGFPADTTLDEVLKKTGAASLSELVRNHKKSW